LANLNDLSALKIDHADRGGGSRTGLWLGAVVVIAALGAGGWYWSSRLQGADVKVAPVTAKTTGPAGGATVLNASGYVTARRRATVSSKVTGKVLEVFIEEGQAVREGQVLARLDDSQTRAALNVAEAQLAAARKSAAQDEARLKEAELNLERRQRLMKEQVVGKAEVDTAQADVDSLKARIAYAHEQIGVAESQVAMQRTELNDMVVRAPFSGIAISKDAQPGEMISPVSAGGGFTRTGIGTIVDMSSLEIEVDVNESYINRVKPGQKVEAVLDAYPDWRIPAHVITTVPTADRQKATVRVRIGFAPETDSGASRGKPAAAKLDPRILPDMGVKVSFLRDDEGLKPAVAEAATVSVPKGAVKVVDGSSIVFVLKEDRVERRAIRAGIESGDEVEVISGLTAGERVVVDAPPQLKDGDRVKVR
jgi:RND family efflux transporter MFP subunit